MNAQLEKSSTVTSVTLISALALLATVAFFVAALIGIIMAIPSDDGSRKQAAVIDRIKPVARIVLTDPNAAPPVAAVLTGPEVYNKVCMACHATGASGAPKVGAKDLWEPRFAQGLDTLVNHAVNGIRAMPAKGGNPALTEANIRDAIVYMLAETGIKTDAAAPAPAAEAAPK